MLTYISNEGKTYEERFEEAITHIPLYTDDWTNFNPSDPGITILENLTGFETIQQDKILDIPHKVRRNLLKMLGFYALRGRGARLLLLAETVRQPVTLPPNHRFMIGDLSFETNRRIDIDDRHLLGIYGKKVEETDYRDFAQLLDREIKVPMLIFGKKPMVGDTLYMVANRLPDAGKEVIFYFSLKERFNRNPLTARTPNTFASLEWECFTESGWQKMDVRDNTNAFLSSGEVRLWIPKGAAVYDKTPQSGYCIRAVLTRAEYDIRPRLTSLEAFLFEVWQKQTRSECHSIGKSREIEIVSGIREDVYMNVFCREGKKESYRRYEFSPHPDRQGRFFDREDIAPGHFKLVFDKKRRGFGPERGRDCVRVLLYTEEVMQRFRIGTVLGYDNQQMQLPFSDIVTHSFSILARRIDRDGNEIFDFVRPERNSDGALYYHLLENDGVIEIEDAGDFIGAELYLGGVSTHSGPQGNIRQGNHLVSMYDDSGNTYYNPGPGTGGRNKETLEDVRQRFLMDMETSYTAVTKKDYEKLICTTPGLCIHKARAKMDEEKNLVSIAVKPGTDEPFPGLPDIYRRMLMRRLEERRLLTTRVELIAPAYMAVNVSGTVYVKLHYEHSVNEIEDVIRGHVDYLHSDKNFGETLHFDEVFHAIEMLECVEYIYDLSLRPQTVALAKMEDADIVPAANCLLYPGQIHIETITFES